MAGNYYDNGWLNHSLGHQELVYRHNLLAASAAQQQQQRMLYQNIGFSLYPGLNSSRLCSRTTSEHKPAFCGSLTSSPVSDTYDSLSLSTDIYSSHRQSQNSNESQTFSSEGHHTETVTLNSSQTLVPDQPIDLSRSRHKYSLENNVKKGSRLENLLNTKRKMSNFNDSLQQFVPLNLSKKTCLPSSLSESLFKDRTVVIDMNDAINNPVELVQLVHLSQTADRITHYMNQMMCKIFVLEPFTDLREADRISLVLNCWHRLLLWIFAEHNFTFQVTQLAAAASPPSSERKPSNKAATSINQPSMAFVKSIATFLKKYKTLEVDETELSLLFAITLFHSADDEAHEEPEKIVRHRKSLLSQLQTYVKGKKTAAGGDKRYVDLLMYLPMLYGVNGKMVEKLFCQHLIHLPSDGDIKISLKETIKNFCISNSP